MADSTCLTHLGDAFPLPGNLDLTYRPVIVWAMNDRMDAQESIAQLDGFERCGYGGVMVMPWGGLPYEFMAEEWLDAVECIVEHAAAIGLDIWIWDDWLFGSGCAGGVLTREPAYRAKGLQKSVDIIIEVGETVSMSLPPRAIAAATFVADKFGNPVGEPTSHDVGPDVSFELRPATRTRLVVVCWQYVSGMVHTTRSHGMFLDPEIPPEACEIYTNDDADAWSVDVLNPDATRGYLTLIHDRYRERLARHFGETVKGFFYDEPKASTPQPWTEDLPERFTAIKGYDIRDRLPEMMIDYLRDGGNHNRWSRSDQAKQGVADYRDVWTRLMAESFYRPIQDWCHRHGVIATGHQLGDNTFEQMFGGGGIVFKNMAYADMPGIDTISGQIKPGRFVDFSRYVGSMAALRGRDRAMSESFAVYGHGITLDEMRYVCEHQLVRGVNTFFLKLSNYNRARSLHFHPPELSDYNPMVREYGRFFCERIDRLAQLLGGGRPGRGVALYVPLACLHSADSEVTAVIDALAQSLVYGQVDFDYVSDEDVRGMKADEQGVMAGGGRLYTNLLLPANAVMDGDIQTAVEQLAGTPGRVCHVDVGTVTAFVQSFHDGDPVVCTTSPRAPVVMRRRVAEDGEQACFLLNESARDESMTLKFVEARGVREIDCKTWQVTCEGDFAASATLSLVFQPGQSRLLLIGAPVDAGAEMPGDVGSATCMAIEDWRVTLPDGRVCDLSAGLRDWSELGLGGFTGMLSYSGIFELPEDWASCWLSLGKVCHAASVAIDGRDVGVAVFTPFSVVLDDLSKGRHSIEVRVLNTMANGVFGDPDRLASLRAGGAFKGTYADIYGPLDVERLPSGLFGPVRLSGRTNGNGNP